MKTFSAKLRPSLCLAILLSPVVMNAAHAGAEHLQCHGGFDKTATYAGSIKCKRVHDRFQFQHQAQKAANHWVKIASCNAHMSSPQKKVWKKDGRWKARVTFICANIS